MSVFCVSMEDYHQTSRLSIRSEPLSEIRRYLIRVPSVVSAVVHVPTHAHTPFILINIFMPQKARFTATYKVALCSFNW